jgi:2'-5' RNA ligase
MIRLFVALEIPDEVKEEVISACKAAAGNEAELRWEAKEKIHLTLKFIGEIKEELLSKIKDEIEFVSNYTSFDCTISKFGFFFRDRQAKILWCNIETDESLFSLVDELNNRLQKFNIEIEKRKFKGHLTLSRIKKTFDEEFIQTVKMYSFTPIEFNADRITLIQSVLKPYGSEYKVLKNYELK